MGTLTIVAKHNPINIEAMSPLPGARQPARIANIAIPPDQSRGADMSAPTKPQKIGGPKLKKKSNGSAIFGMPMPSLTPCFHGVTDVSRAKPSFAGFPDSRRGMRLDA